MDPCGGGPLLATRWLPRARGDGPRDPHYRVTFRRASPRSRGWTHRMWPDPARLMGFPALAGMDPDWRGLFQDAFRLPRARGDGPVMNRLMLESWWASPRSRGWTPQRLTRAPQFGGFPALAGMDPPASPAASGSPGLPRARGDGPVHADRPQRRRLASPRSRGWTPLGGGGTGCDPGFPALAGMDPPRAARRRSGSGLPRARGDGP